MNIPRMDPIDPLKTLVFEGIYEECTRMHTIIDIFNDSHLAKRFLILWENEWMNKWINK